MRDGTLHLATPAAEASSIGVRASWPWFLGLLGLDCLSTLAYVPSIAVQEAGDWAPAAAVFAAAGMLLALLPIYIFVARRSTDGFGSVGLLDRHLGGWSGKSIVLVVLGFLAADFVLTRTFSTADAAEHVVRNPAFRPLLDRLDAVDEAIRPLLPSWMGDALSRGWNHRVGVAVILILLSFGFWWFFRKGVTRGILRAAAAVVIAFLALNLLVLGAGVAHLAAHPDTILAWLERIRSTAAGTGGGAASWIRPCLAALPILVLGFAGFELSLVVVPNVMGREGDGDAAGRAPGVRNLLAVTACSLVIALASAVLVTALLVPRDALGPGGLASNRALAYLAHGGPLADGAERLAPFCGGLFGTVYDLSAVLILSLAGASVTLGLHRLVPPMLARFGMSVSWAQRTGALPHLLNLVNIAVIVVFGASVAAQRGAYATSVLALFTSAAGAAAVAAARAPGNILFRASAAAFFGIAGVMVLIGAGSSVILSPGGLVIALLFVITIIVTSLLSRIARSTELRFSGFEFADAESLRIWETLKPLPFPVLVPHRPGRRSVADKAREIRRMHRLGPGEPVVLVQAVLGDTSEFYQLPLVHAREEGDLILLRITRCASIAHTIAAVALELSRQSAPPEIHFGWSDENPLAANLKFVLFGEGNVPWLARELIRRAEPDPERRPRVFIG